MRGLATRRGLRHESAVDLASAVTEESAFHNLVAGYFHEDWDIEGPTVEGVRSSVVAVSIRLNVSRMRPE